jgi:transposase-like protein
MSAMYSTKERERVLAEFEASDLSAQAFCRKLGISRATLRVWQEDAEERREEPRTSSLFARVKIAPSTAVSVPLEVCVGESRVVVPPGFDPQHLRAVIEALGARK